MSSALPILLSVSFGFAAGLILAFFVPLWKRKSRTRSSLDRLYEALEVFLIDQGWERKSHNVYAPPASLEGKIPGYITGDTFGLKSAMGHTLEYCDLG